MFDTYVPKISSSMAQAIQEAVLLGNAKDIDGILTLVKFDEDFPKNLRYGLEAIYYFRLYYGKGGELEPAKDEDKKRMLEMEALWGRQLIESLDYYSDLTTNTYVTGIRI
jgi:hypothetical protein